MATTASAIIARALGYSVFSDSSLTSDGSEMLSQINAIQNFIFTRVASASRYFWTQSDVTSTSGSSGRQYDLTGTTGIERVLQIWRTTNPSVLLSRVDIEDQGAELPPRYYTAGTTIYEVDSDWSDSTGTVALTIVYAKQATQLTTTGALTQNVTLPDAYADLLSLGLAEYLARKDAGRNPAEADSLKAQFDERLANVIISLDHFGGVAHRRFLSPEPKPPTEPGGSA